MTPEQIAKDNSEHGHQTALFCKFAQNFDTYPALRFAFAIPNGGERNIRVAANLKAEGVRSGVPDVCVPVVVGKWSGLWIEMKRPESVTSKGKKRYAGVVEDDQKRWHEYLRSAGYGVVVAYTWEQAWNYVVQYLTWREDNA